MRRWLALVAAVMAVAGPAGCSGSSAGPDEVAGSLGGSITVSAAASLTAAFTTIRDGFVADHPGVEVVLNLGASGQLATQVEEGAPVDVVAFADTDVMQRLEQGEALAGDPQVFARNRLVIVTQPGNPAGVEDLADLATAGVVALCATTAPCGTYADRILADAGVSIPLDRITRGRDATATLAAVRDGDATAAVVYATDAMAAGAAVEVVDVPEAEGVLASYPIAVVAGTANRALAEAFVALVLSGDGAEVLGRAGFLPA